MTHFHPSLKGVQSFEKGFQNTESQERNAFWNIVLCLKYFPILKSNKFYLHVVFCILVKELQHFFKTRKPLLAPVSLWMIMLFSFSYTETVFLQQLYFYVQMHFLYAPVILFNFNLHNSIRIMEYFNTFFSNRGKTWMHPIKLFLSVLQSY